MKTAVCNTRHIDRIPYPNAATRREILHKVLDLALLAASGAGIAAILALLVIL
jgi:hypothetical protein